MKSFSISARDFRAEFLPGELHPLLFLDLRTRLNAEHGIVRARVGGVDVVDVVGGDDLEVKFLGQLEEAGDDLELLGDAVVLDFDEIVLPAKQHRRSGRRPCGPPPRGRGGGAGGRAKRGRPVKPIRPLAIFREGLEVGVAAYSQKPLRWASETSSRRFW